MLAQFKPNGLSGPACLSLDDAAAPAVPEDDELNKLISSLLRNEDAAFSQDNVVRHELLPGTPAGTAFVLENILSRSECLALMAVGESLGYEGCGYKESIRVTDRVQLTHTGLASRVFARVKPFLPPTVDLRLRRPKLPTESPPPVGVRSDLSPGVYCPIGVNDCMRLCKYSPGGFFLPHLDGAYDDDGPGGVERWSLQTLMLYLNDDYGKGSTRFFNGSQPKYKAAVEGNVVASWKPTAGSCLIFNQCQTHDGEAVENGSKYIMRTEVLFARRPGS